MKEGEGWHDIRWLYLNHVQSATITPLTENPDYPFDTALKDSRLSRRCQTLSDTSQTIIFDLGTAQNINYIDIQGHNITAGATMTLEGNASDSWGAPSFSVSLTGFNQYFSTQNFRYWRLSVSDASNTDDYLEFGNIYLGSYLQLPYMNKSQKLPTASLSSSTDTVSGQSYMDTGLIYIYGNVNFPYVTDTEKTAIDTAFISLDKFKPFVMLIWENDTSYQPPLYCKLTSDLDWQRVESIAGRMWSLSFSFKQIF